MKGKTKDIVLMGVVLLFCFLPLFSIYPFNVPEMDIIGYLVLCIRLLAYFIAGGIVGYSLKKVIDKKLLIGYIAVTILYIIAIVVMGLRSFEISAFDSYMDMFGFEMGLIFLESLLVMLGYAGIDKLVKHLSGRKSGFNLNRCFLVMGGFAVLLWNVDYWMNGIEGLITRTGVVMLLCARYYGVVMTGIVAGWMLGGYGTQQFKNNAELQIAFDSAVLEGLRNLKCEIISPEDKG